MLNEYFNSVILHRKGSNGRDVKTKHYLLGTGNAHILLISSNRQKQNLFPMSFYIFLNGHTKMMQLLF